ncbi:MAG: PKD domain-containing protein [Bacteroidota bacterium]|nr:PKD domain-containing protein [Bacteroidota bacterium]
MKTITQIKKALLIICAFLAFKLNSQPICQAFLTSSDSGNANFYLHGDTNVPWPNGTQSNYTWDFGDGRAVYSYNGPNGLTQGWGSTNCPPYVYHQYITNGTFIVTFTAHMNDASNPNTTCDAVMTDTIVVSGLPCNLTPTIDYTQTGTYTFDISGFIPIGNVLSQSMWTITEENFTQVNGPANFSHTFPGPGTYNVCYYVEGGDGSASCSDSVCTTIYVDCPVTDTISYTQIGTSPAFHFEVNSNDTGFVWSNWYISPTGYFIDDIGIWGDSLTYTFPANGNYFVSWKEHGTQCWTTTQVYVFSPSLMTCHASFTMFEDSTNAGNWFAYNTSTGNNLNYYWDFGDGISSTQQYPFHTYTVPGHYDICLTVQGDSCVSSFCDSSSVHRMTSSGMSSFNVLASPTGVKTNESVISMINIFPNPVTDELNLQLITAEAKDLEIVLSDMLGKTIIKNEFSISAGENQIKLNTSEISNGVYMISITDKKGNRIKAAKIIK